MKTESVIIAERDLLLTAAKLARELIMNAHFIRAAHVLRDAIRQVEKPNLEDIPSPEGIARTAS